MNIQRHHFQIVSATILGLSITQVNFSAIRQDPLLVCAIMIKNEAPVIEQTLKAMVDGGIDSFLVYDTGSTDTTIAEVNKFFQEQNITNFAIEQEEFVDFSTSRNKALDLVDKYFPDATFIYMPDAEWILHNGSELIKFCEEQKNKIIASYGIRLIMNGTCDFPVDRLIRKKSKIRFRGSVHETLEFCAGADVPNKVFIEFKPTRHGAEKTFERFKRDLKLLLKDFAQNPNDPRIVFYLAQTYACIGDHENAVRFYELRITLNGWPEENFMATYRLAQEIEALAANDPKNETLYTWELAQYYYLKAFSMRSTRIEPLGRIALHYLNSGENALAYLFAIRACTVKYPNDRLFVEKDMYTYWRYEIVGRSAWYIGEFDVGEWALRKALKKNPGDKHFESNLSFYVNSMNTVDQTLTPSAGSCPLVMPGPRNHIKSDYYSQCNFGDGRSLERGMSDSIRQIKTQSHSAEEARRLHQLIRKIIDEGGSLSSLAEQAAKRERTVVVEFNTLMTTPEKINHEQDPRP